MGEGTPYRVDVCMTGVGHPRREILMGDGIFVFLTNGHPIGYPIWERGHPIGWMYV